MIYIAPIVKRCLSIPHNAAAACIFLLEGENVSSNAGSSASSTIYDTVSVVLYVDFSPRFNENEVAAIEFRHSNRDHHGLADSGTNRQKTPSADVDYKFIGLFCEFIEKPL